MRFLKIGIITIVFCVLTVLTQVGGLIFLLSILTHKFTDKWANNRGLKVAYRLISFLALYSVATFLIVPVLAKPFGRVPLPLTETNHLQPLTTWTCFLNRHYVRAELKESISAISEKMDKAYPGTTVNYLDANFPFFNKFPLVPHLSHNDGKKLDLSFCYIDIRKNAATNESPSFIGYGVCEMPLPGEVNTADFCAVKGYWQYSLISKIVSQENKQHFVFDEERTKKLMELICAQPTIGKVFIEPHLKTRLNLYSEKIRFHGCQAVRHDDHIHIQLK